MATTELIELSSRNESSKPMYLILTFPIGAVLADEGWRTFIQVSILKMLAIGLTNCGERTAIFKAVSEGAT